MMLLTAQDIRDHSFDTVRLTEGYDVNEVDQFLDRVEHTLEFLASPQADQATIPSSLDIVTPQEVREFTFNQVHFKEGYDVNEVDQFLDDVTATLQSYQLQAQQKASRQ